MRRLVSVPDSGFTLLELLVVLTIMGLVSALGATMSGTRLSGAREARVEADLLHWLRARQQHAAESGQMVAVTAASAQLRSGDAVWQVPSGSKLASAAPLHFYPDGSASQSVVRLQAGDHDVVVSVDGLTGHMAVVR